MYKGYNMRKHRTLSSVKREKLDGKEDRCERSERARTEDQLSAAC